MDVVWIEVKKKSFFKNEERKGIASQMIKI
jgi:hypothetical protein